VGLTVRSIVQTCTTGHFLVKPNSGDLSVPGYYKVFLYWVGVIEVTFLKAV